MSIEEQIIAMKILDHIQPPPSFPATPSHVLEGMEQYFYEQCQKFLTQESKFHRCSKKMEIKIQNAILGTTEINEKLSQHSESLKKLVREVDRLNVAERETGKKEQILSCLCEMVKMEEMRGTLLQAKVVDEEHYLKTLKDLDQVVKDLSQMNLQLEAKIVHQLKDQLVSLLEEAVQKLIKENLSHSLITKILGEYSEPFLRNPTIALVFKQNLKNNRLSYFRISLNPLINSINYANNVVELYESISKTWVGLVRAEKKLFFDEKVNPELKGMVKETMVVLLAELMPKLERNMYKVKDVVETAMIRYHLSMLLQELLEISKSDWEALLKVLQRLQVVLEENLDNAGEQLEIAKYNIYSLVSYLPIRELLEKIKQLKQLHVEGGHKIAYQKPFKRLAESRDPSKNPKNKSLLIFNLNIWYLYLHILKNGQLSEKAKATLSWCKEAFVGLNIEAVKKDYNGKGFVKLLDFCSNYAEAKKILFSEISLLGHEKLRSMVEEDLLDNLISQVYLPLLHANGIETQLSTEEVLRKAELEKINMNKYGKLAENIRVFSVEELRVVLG